MKRFLALTLCLLMVLPLCPALAEEQELIVITILCHAETEPWLTAEYANFEVGRVFDQILAERYGLKLELEGIDNSVFVDVVNSRVAAGVDLPDIISAGWDSFDAISWARNGMLMSVSDLMEQYDTDGSILAYYNKCSPGAVGANTAPDGKMYWFSYLSGRDFFDPETDEEIPMTAPRTLAVRKDWLDKLNIEYKYTYTPDELYDILVAFREQDANGNGLADEVANLEFDGFWNGIAQGFDLSWQLLCGYGTDDKVYSNFYHENFPAYIEFMRKLYEADLLDTAVLTDTSTFDNAIQTENRASVNMGYVDYEGFERNCSDENALYLSTWIDLDGLENGFHAIDDPKYNTYSMYLVTSACKNPEAVIKLFDFVYTDEYSALAAYGLEDLGYTRSENGVYIPAVIPGDADTYDSRYSLSWCNFAIMALPNARTLPEYKTIRQEGVTERTAAKQQVMYDWIYDMLPNAEIECAFAQLAIATEEEAELIANTEEQLNTYASELLVDLILGRKTLDNMDEYRGELEKLGLGEYMEVMQARRDRYVSAG